MQVTDIVRIGVLGVALAGAGVSMAAETMTRPASPQDVEFFETKVRPVLSQHCYGCHGAEKQKGGLRLDHIQFVLEGGDTGPALVPGKAAESLIEAAVGYNNVDLQMPPKGLLPEEARAAPLPFHPRRPVPCLLHL